MMTRRGFTSTLLLGAAALGLGGCEAVVSPDAVVRYRLMVAVETATGVKSGSSVIELQASRNADWERKATGRTGGYSIRGEAVAVDLGSGRTLFALLRGESESVGPFDWLWIANGVESGSFDDPQSLLEHVGSIKGEKSLPRAYKTGCVPNQNCDDAAYPMLVTFKDIADPTSVMRVDPDDLAASFGADYRLKEITVTVTDEPVTVGIERRLAWLKDPKIMTNPGWARLPLESRKAINGLFSGTIGQSK